MHLFVYSLNLKAFDQEIFMGYRAPRPVFPRDYGKANIRAESLGKNIAKNIASQLSNSFNEARYLGLEPEGACPYCNLCKIEISYNKGQENRIGDGTSGEEGSWWWMKMGSETGSEEGEKGEL
jgi:hypothetical protein